LSELSSGRVDFERRLHHHSSCNFDAELSGIRKAPV
jgi:hypothetical protein